MMVVSKNVTETILDQKDYHTENLDALKDLISFMTELRFSITSEFHSEKRSHIIIIVSISREQLSILFKIVMFWCL